MNDDKQLSDQLRKRADAVGGGHPISFDDVKRSARTMKWQQRAAAGGVAAVVLAVAVPAGIALSRNNDDKQTGPTATQTPTDTTPTPTPTPAGAIPLDIAAAPQGVAPAVSWVQGKTLHQYDGETATLPRADYFDVAGYHGGWLALRQQQGSPMVDTVDSSDKVTSTAGGSYRFAVGVDGTQLAWVADGRLMTGIPSGMGEGEQTATIPSAPLVYPVGWSDGGHVLFSTDGDNVSDRGVYTTDFQGPALKLPGALRAGGVSETTGMVSVMTSADDNGSCWQVEAVKTRKVAFKTCRYSLDQFSSDGRYLIGYPAYADGIGPRDISVLDAATGKVVVHYVDESGNGYVHQAVWDGDGNSLIANVYEDGAWTLVRLGLDGKIERATDSVTSSFDTDSPFNLVSRG